MEANAYSLQLGGSAADLERPFASWSWGACISEPFTTLNWSWPATDYYLPWPCGQLPCKASPCGPIIFTFSKILPYFVRSWEMLRRQHGVRRNEKEGVLRYWVAQYLGLFLIIL